MYQERHGAIKQAVTGNMWCFAANRIGSPALEVGPRVPPVSTVAPRPPELFPLSFICGFYEARCWTQGWPWQRHVHETGISWSFTEFHFNKLAPNYRSIIGPGFTDVFGRGTRTLYSGVTHRGHCLSLWLHTWNTFKGRCQMASQIKMNVSSEFIYLFLLQQIGRKHEHGAKHGEVECLSQTQLKKLIK